MRVAVKSIGPVEANCYILDRRIMIDPGDGIGELERFIAEENAQIEAIVLTHGHFDHILGAAHIKKLTHAKIYIGAEDAECLKDEDACCVLPYSTTPFEPAEPDAILSEGDIEIASLPFRVMLTPGHTKGGICLISDASKLVFTGDTLFARGFGRTDLRGGSTKELYRSLMRLLELPGDYYAYPGHGEGAYISDIKKGFAI
ncbi:MAG: MBL fold metallo-hydrolase [Clostridia bacterium]|nr:MBL fold metallo-hydrolase [Clostridia bacterium]